MKYVALILSIPAVLCINTCNRIDFNDHEKDLLVAKYWYGSINDTMPMKTSRYLYDCNDRLVKINHCRNKSFDPFIYEDFKYNHKNELENRLTYHYANDSTGWVLSDSTHYTYEKEKLIREESIYPSPTSYSVLYIYEYKDDKLDRKNQYVNYQFESSTIYEYTNDLCSKEIRYSDSTLENIHIYTHHYYNGNLLVMSEKYTSQNYMFQIISFSYDEDGNLITEQSTETDYAVNAPVGYFFRYEYF